MVQGKVFVPMEVWPTWLIESIVQGNHSPYVYTVVRLTLPCRTVMLQIRLYVLYRRSKKILVFLVTFFLAQAAAMLCIYIDFSATAKG